MCSGEKILPYLKQIKSKKKELRCLVESSCWCMKLQTKLTHDSDECMSPQDILDLGVNLTDQDTKYLESLKDREFVQ
jgi:hypothetical protein